MIVMSIEQWAAINPCQFVPLVFWTPKINVIKLIFCQCSLWMSLCHGPPAKCVIHSFVGVGFQKLLHLSEWIEWSGVLSFGSSGNLFFCCDIVYVPRVPPDSRSHTPFASYWSLEGVNRTISDLRLFRVASIFHIWYGRNKWYGPHIIHFYPLELQIWKNVASLE